MTALSPPSEVGTDDIAAGLGLSNRAHLCGLLALLETARAASLIEGVARDIKGRIGQPTEPATAGLQRAARELQEGPLSDDMLRFRLWSEMDEVLGGGAAVPLSRRKLHQTGAALGFAAAEVLRPEILARRRGPQSWTDRIRGKIVGAAPEPISFPDIVAGEMTALIETLAKSEGLDPELAEALAKGQAAIRAATLAGGGWVAFATAVGSSGFAPYLLAAKVAGMLPLVTGPALVSLLAVAVNPLTVVAGTAALGWWVTQGAVSNARRVAAARVAVLLALDGMRDREAGIAALLTSFRRLGQLSKAQLAPLPAPQRQALEVRLAAIRAVMGPLPQTRRPGPFWQRTLPVDVTATAGLTLAEMILDAAAIDPDVLAAADFSRSLNLDSALDLALNISSFAGRGAGLSLRGYTAERFVMSRLAAEGHAVSLPDTSNMPGYDLLVDGLPVQVKCGTSLSLLSEHFARYPDIPVIADHGLLQLAQASGAPWAEMVGTVEGFDLAHVETLVQQTLSAAEGLAHPDVPLFAMLVAGLRGVAKVRRGAIALEDLPTWAIVNLSIRGVLSTGGQLGGQVLGLLILGPAGALVLGPAMGVASLFGTGWLHGKVDVALRGPWLEDVLAAAQVLRGTLEASLQRRVDGLARRQARLAATSHASDLDWIEDGLADDLVAAVEALLDLPPATTLPQALELLVEATGMAALDKDVRAARLRLEAVLAARPTTMAVLSKVRDELLQRHGADG